jgi:hypothetical protein
VVMSYATLTWPMTVGTHYHHPAPVDPRTKALMQLNNPQGSAAYSLQPTSYKLELELIQSHMAQKPMLRGEVGARALRVRSDLRGHGQVRLCKSLGCVRCGCF